MIIKKQSNEIPQAAFARNDIVLTFPYFVLTLHQSEDILSVKGVDKSWQQLI